MTRARLLGAAGAALAVVLAACDPFGPLGVLTDEQRLDTIVLTPDSTNVKVGDSVQVVFKLVGKGGGTVAGTPSFSAGNPVVISVASTGWVKALRVGRSEVLATLNQKRGASVVVVTP
ncbi:MAG: hypothetical protein HY275_15105 [Gemmatimonadetes bacterium]|nr:hypothetical protein [Gemmatimonadota bacterium]